jgi:hypothetical protein
MGVHKVRKLRSIGQVPVLKPGTEQNYGITMFNTSNEGTGGLGIFYSSRKRRGKVLNFI